MSTKYGLLLVILTLPASWGCGTMVALQRNDYWPNQIYAGTRASAGGHATQWDIPFSLVADTVVLPYTIPRTIYNKDHPPATRPAYE